MPGLREDGALSLTFCVAGKKLEVTYIFVPCQFSVWIFSLSLKFKNCTVICLKVFIFINLHEPVSSSFNAEALRISSAPGKWQSITSPLSSLLLSIFKALVISCEISPRTYPVCLIFSFINSTISLLGVLLISSVCQLINLVPSSIFSDIYNLWEGTYLIVFFHSNLFLFGSIFIFMGAFIW